VSVRSSVVLGGIVLIGGQRFAFTSPNLLTLMLPIARGGYGSGFGVSW
jgi:hypothetical protein